jgi:tetratricopeptide (TPR) repeat protein
VRVMKHNPAFLAADDLVQGFVVRHRELEELLSVLRDQGGGGSQHLLVIAGRGMGKTMLVRRLVAEVRRAPDLSARWFPIPFGEESYEVGTEGELWLAALGHLADAATAEPRWRESWERLRTERDDKRLAAAALARLLDFADEKGRRLLLVVENLDQLFETQLSEADAWAIRRVLQGEPRILLLATAVRRFEGVDQPDQPLFELFQRMELEALSTEDCGAVWSSVVGEPIDAGRARAIQILTGGNPRLVVLLASFAGGRDLRALLDDLASLIDEHTDYFKSNIEVLPAKLRKVFLALAELWAPATARQVSERARVGVSEASAMLGRLVDQGRVTIVRTRGKTHHYQVAERLYNIYYLMRHRSGPEGRVVALMDFIAHFYVPDELPGLLSDIALLRRPDGETWLPEALKVFEDGADPELEWAIRGQRALLAEPDDELLTRVGGWLAYLSGLRPRVLELSKSRLRANPDSAELATLVVKCADYRSSEDLALVRSLVSRWEYGPLQVAAAHLFVRNGDQDALSTAKRAVELAPHDALAWTYLAQAHQLTEQAPEGVNAAERALQLDPSLPRAWATRLHFASHSGFEELFERAVQHLPTAELRGLLAAMTGLVAPDSAVPRLLALLREAMAPGPYATVLRQTLGLLLLRADQPREALATFAPLLRDAQYVRFNPSEAQGDAIRLAACGLVRETLELLADAPSAPLLEPLVVALRLKLGEMVDAPVEVLEVAQDVIARIDEAQPLSSSFT